MKIGLMFASSAYTTAEECTRAVAVAEDVGIESIWAVEHVLAPLHLRSAYPYTEDGKVTGVSDGVFCDPIVWLSFVAGISRTLRLGTGIMILPQRHPAYVAKEWATLDRLSGGRAMLGIGVGWLREEMEAIGVPFNERGARTDESIVAIRSLWADGPSTFEGRFYRWKEMLCNPKPVQKPGVPIIVGGHTPAAARRVARLGDGFFWVGSLNKSIRAGDDRAFAEMLTAIRAECTRIGRDPASIEVTAGASGATLDDLRRLRDLGVQRVVVGATKLERLRSRLERIEALAQAVG